MNFLKEDIEYLLNVILKLVEYSFLTYNKVKNKYPPLFKYSDLLSSDTTLKMIKELNSSLASPKLPFINLECFWGFIYVLKSGYTYSFHLLFNLYNLEFEIIVVPYLKLISVYFKNINSSNLYDGVFHIYGKNWKKNLIKILNALFSKYSTNYF